MDPFSRSWIGEQPDPDSRADWESLASGAANSGMMNPNATDLPSQAVEGEGLASPSSQLGSVWWSDRYNTEALLQQMRPANLPRPVSSSGTARSRLDGSIGGWRDEGLESREPPYDTMIDEAATEIMRQTSVAGYPEGSSGSLCEPERCG